ncbi:hypothetical protein MZD04_gp026 [Pseudomonas phage Psa21]|uniref:Uncharacterized protein n=1 Tax=Pseudomonas phage Psa21 TaxID=2530023 RepID=A0A481W4B9_9CAUD|nr:hypothetical protein MZD04_gp026 [Pseudomonas phage Psa21]QBJ02556.1 hypothetical protein PSA21_26 [Pseudomonas phage Psa21]
MQLSKIKAHLAETIPGITQVDAWERSQAWGYIDKHRVAFVGMQYELVMQPSPDPLKGNVAARLLFQRFKERLELSGKYANRQSYCKQIDKELLALGYTLTSCLVHQHAFGDMVRTEYFRPADEEGPATSIVVPYLPTDFMPLSVGKTDAKEQEYYTPGYESGVLTYLGTSGMDGRPYRRINITPIEGPRFPSQVLPYSMEDNLDQLDIVQVYTRTFSESQEGWRCEYTGDLANRSSAVILPVEIVVENFHWKV